MTDKEYDATKTSLKNDVPMKSIFRALALYPIICLSGNICQAGEPAPGSISSAIDTAYELPWKTRIITGFDTGANEREGRFDVFFPVHTKDNTLFFLYPRVGWASDSDGAVSLGGGARTYLPEMDAIFGVNVFYDNYESQFGNRFSQLGVGTEFLTENLDFRFNYYLPEGGQREARNITVANPFTTTRTTFGTAFASESSIFQRRTVRTQEAALNQVFRSTEEAMNGLDTEVGMKAPYIEDVIPGEIRMYGGFYSFENPFGGDLEGGKARGEWRLSQKLALETAWYEDEEVLGDNWTFGFRVSLPIEDGPTGLRDTFAGIFKDKKKPSRSSSFAAGGGSYVFASSDSSVLDRMTEEVNRTHRVLSSESPIKEDVAARTLVLGEVTRTSEIEEVHDDVVFVGAGGLPPRLRMGPSGDGTFENPTASIQQGVDTASSLFGESGQVIVSSDFGDYTEDVLVSANSVKIWGGNGIPVNGGQRFSDGGARTDVNGSFTFSNIASARVSGFHISGGGIEADDVKTLVVTDNEITGTIDAINIEFDDGAGDMTFTIDNNFIHDNDSSGIDYTPSGNGETVVGVISNNTFSNNSVGFFAYLEDYDVNATFDVFGNTFSDNNVGIELDSSDMDEADQTVKLKVHDNTFMNSGDTGVWVDYADADNDGSFDVNVTLEVVGNDFLGNSYDVYFDVGSDSSADDASYTWNVDVIGNTFSDTTDDSVWIGISDDYDGGGILTEWNIDVSENTFETIGSSAITVDITDGYYDDITVNLNISDNKISDVGSDGINVQVSDTDDASTSKISAEIAGNTILNVSDIGIDVYFSDFDDISLIFGGNFVNGAGLGVSIDGEGAAFDDGVFGNNLISDSFDADFSINGVNGTVLINGVENPRDE